MHSPKISWKCTIGKSKTIYERLEMIVGMDTTFWIQHQCQNPWGEKNNVTSFISLAIRRMEIKTDLRIYLPLSKWQRSTERPRVNARGSLESREFFEKGNPHSLMVVFQSCVASMETSVRNSQKTKNKYTIRPSYTQTLWHMPEGLILFHKH